MTKTKKRILDCAKTLFNEKGYRNVTIRMIAEELAMSSGNLNYHFKKREDILEALYFEMVSVFDKRVDNVLEVSFTVELIYKDIYVSMERMVEYRFFWTDMYHILNEHGTIKMHFNNVYDKRKAGFLYLCHQLVKEGKMLTPSYKGQYNDLAEQMIIYGNTWLYASLLYNEALTLEIIKKSAKAMINLIFPYLNQTCQEEVIAL